MADDAEILEKRAIGLEKELAREREKRRAAEEQAAEATAAAEARKAEAAAAVERAKADVKAAADERERLAKEHAELVEYRTATEKQHDARRAARKEALGADWAELIPDGLGGSALDAQLTRLEQRKAVLATATPAAAPLTAPAPVVPPGSGGAGNPPAPSALVSDAEREWMSKRQPAWLHCPPSTQRTLLDRHGPKR